MENKAISNAIASRVQTYCVSMLICDTGVSPVPATRIVKQLLFSELFDFSDDQHGRDGHVTPKH
jgi:hypothetical protein